MLINIVKYHAHLSCFSTEALTQKHTLPPLNKCEMKSKINLFRGGKTRDFLFRGEAYTNDIAEIEALKSRICQLLLN